MAVDAKLRAAFVVRLGRAERVAHAFISPRDEPIDVHLAALPGNSQPCLYILLTGK
jgi:hypothetical protein